jgi:hypothetical protein
MGELSSRFEAGWHGLEEWSQSLGESRILRIAGLAGLVVGVTAAGLLVGRELRIRYKFKRRTPTDLFSKAGDPLAGAEYGMGV